MTAAAPPPGPATDARGVPVTDPSVNVGALVKASVRRLDDLRKAESHRINREAKLRADHAKELALAESKRIDAVRQVDVVNGEKAATALASQVSALAGTTATLADTLRLQVESKATTATENLKSELDPMRKDILELGRVWQQQVGERLAAAENKTGERWNITTLIAAL